MNDWQYQWLSEQAYWVEESRKDVPHHPRLGKVYFYDLNNEPLGQFQVLKVIDNTENGMQAMAVAL